MWIVWRKSSEQSCCDLLQQRPRYVHMVICKFQICWKIHISGLMSLSIPFPLIPRWIAVVPHIIWPYLIHVQQLTWASNLWGAPGIIHFNTLFVPIIHHKPSILRYAHVHDGESSVVHPSRTWPAARGSPIRTWITWSGPSRGWNTEFFRRRSWHSSWETEFPKIQVDCACI